MRSPKPRPAGSTPATAASSLTNARTRRPEVRRAIRVPVVQRRGHTATNREMRVQLLPGMPCGCGVVAAPRSATPVTPVRVRPSAPFHQARRRVHQFGRSFNWIGCESPKLRMGVRVSPGRPSRDLFFASRRNRMRAGFLNRRVWVRAAPPAPTIRAIVKGSMTRYSSRLSQLSSGLSALSY